MKKSKPNVNQMLSELDEQFSYMAVMRATIDTQEGAIKQDIIFTSLMIVTLQFNADYIEETSINYFVLNMLYEDLFDDLDILEKSNKRLEYINEYESLLQEEWAELQILIEDKFNDIEYVHSEERSEKRRKEMSKLITLIEV